MMVKRVQRSRKKGAKLPPHTLCVTRPGIYGNPWETVDEFRTWVYLPYQAPLRESFIAECKQKGIENLACWCPLTAECHADVWIEILNSCQCHVCVDMCKWPCLGTPAEIQAIISSGYAFPNLLAVCDDNHPSLDFMCVKPRRKYGKCVYLKQGKCVLHEPGLKPFEGRFAHHSKAGKKFTAMYRKIAKSWDTKQGRELIARIRAENKGYK